MNTKVRRPGHFAPNRQARKAPKGQPFGQQVFMPGGKCHQRVVAWVVSTLHQPFQPRNVTINSMMDLFTTTTFDAIEAGVPPAPRPWVGRICRNLSCVRNIVDGEGGCATTLVRQPPGYKRVEDSKDRVCESAGGD